MFRAMLFALPTKEILQLHILVSSCRITVKHSTWMALQLLTKIQLVCFLFMLPMKEKNSYPLTILQKITLKLQDFT